MTAPDNPNSGFSRSIKRNGRGRKRANFLAGAVLRSVIDENDFQHRNSVRPDLLDECFYVLRFVQRWYHNGNSL